jgi:hypothetical protein
MVDKEFVLPWITKADNDFRNYSVGLRSKGKEYGP